MPILKFSGISEKRVEQYSELANEIADLIVAAPENITFICENSTTFPKQGKKAPIYITVEWMKRENKEQLLTDHLVNFFKNDGTKVWVFYTDVNGKIYMDGIKKG